MNVGFIGLGIMGSRMASNLLWRGHALVVHNRTRAKAEPLLRDGAAWAESPAELAGRVDALLTMLAHPEAVSGMALGENGFLGGLRPGALWLDCSTVNPSFSRQMAGRARDRGIRFLDTPVLGSAGPAAAGELTILAGGEAADLEAARPLLEAVATRILHVGAVGMGTSLKMVLNLILAEGMVAFAEGLALGRSLGLEPGMLLDFLASSPVLAPFVARKRPKVESGNYEPEFPLQWMQKDLHLAAVTAYEQGVALPMAGAARELYALAAQHGLADQDFSAIYKYLAEQGPTQPSRTV
jgi:3-hydroxyisobutyrate dehydrogenase/glyoxylate/succinic semialdehyde reductase